MSMEHDKYSVRLSCSFRESFPSDFQRITLAAIDITAATHYRESAMAAQPTLISAYQHQPVARFNISHVAFQKRTGSDSAGN
jgi:hypothetical protein